MLEAPQRKRNEEADLRRKNKEKEKKDKLIKDFF